jgi:hypothetical protein
MTRTRFLTALAVVLAVVAGACGGSKATPLETVRGASSATASAKSAAMSMTIKGASGALSNLSFSGGFDFDKHLAKVTIDGSKMGLPGGGNIDAIMDFSDGAIEFMKIPGLAKELNGKHWVKLDLAATMAQACPGFDFGSLLKAQSGDPTSGLQVLTAADKVTVVGKEKVRGEQTTHYQVQVNLAKVVANAPEASRETMRKLAEFYVNPVLQQEVWIDGDGRARRVQQTVDSANMKLPDCMKAASAQNPFTGTTTVTYEMYDFGKPVDVTIPVANDVADFQELMRQGG